MKKISELMDELGFDPEGSTAVKEAFIKYLIKQSEGVNVLAPTEKALIKANPEKVRFLRAAPLADQLSFEFAADLHPKSSNSRKSNK
ncbi:MAG: hypothetical protein EOP06_12120 [Proteobacteria bacterium]|nr:MAG: hypothetical protein EOP06_12120 [Pseudomonadota bacterium]